MVNIVIKKRTPLPCGEVMSVAAEDEAGKTLSTGLFTLTRTAFSGGTVKTMTAGGIETPPENRRRGNIRAMLTRMHEIGRDEGAAVALLHPFSFTYYNKFGYERVADHLIATFPASALDFVGYDGGFVPYDESLLPDMLKIYVEFSRGRNLLLPRYDGSHYTGGGKSAYICYENGEPSAYVVFSGSKTYSVNTYINTKLTVHELAYVSPSALSRVFSFLRMFEGEYETVQLCDCSLYREADLMLRHYADTEYKLIPDIAARVLDTEKLLDAHTYPQNDGTFTVRVEDGMDSVAGLFCVSYGKDGHEVRRLTDGDADLTVTAGALTRIIYGAPACDTRGLSYLPGVKVHKDCTDLIRAFPCVPAGVFEHF
ncbi:MAG: GNAT family N-acetyltransferase [Clostridia bacterium]|nr:GNAT family N-acetyltransferase [Clostridia bacterium]